MKRLAPLTAAVGLLVPSLAVAEEAGADCSGWTVTATAFPDAGSYYASATAYLYLWDGADWVLVDTSFDEGVMTDTYTEWGVFTSVFILGNDWEAELPPGDYRLVVDGIGWESGVNGTWETVEEARGLIDVWSPQRTFLDEVEFTCDPPPTPARTPRYWRRHPQAWPVLDLQLGDLQATFDQECLRDLMRLRPRRDARVKLLRHLIAAKLNIANGSDAETVTGFPAESSTILDTIAAADAFLRSDEIGCCGLEGPRPRGAERHEAVALKNALFSYNHGLESSAWSWSGCWNQGSQSHWGQSLLQLVVLYWIQKD